VYLRCPKQKREGNSESKRRAERKSRIARRGLPDRDVQQKSFELSLKR
jgi:hypothetical protein